MDDSKVWEHHIHDFNIMRNLYEIVSDFLSYKEEISIGDCNNPKDVIAKVVSAKPEILYYIQSFSWSLIGTYTTLIIKYMNQSIPINKVYYAKGDEIEYRLRQTVIGYENKVILVLSNSDNLQWILKCFMTKSISFYPNVKSYTVSSLGFDSMNIPYTVYEISFSYRIGTVMLKQMEIEVEKKVKELSKTLFPFYMPDSAKCYIAHNYLASTIEYYNIDNGSPLERSYVQSAYGALLRGKCVCQGYAEAYKRILNSVGIPCDLVSGKVLDSDEGWHAWNIVHVNNNTVHAHVDVTWDSHNKKASTEYFGKGDDHFDNKREWNRFFYTHCQKDNNLLIEARYFCRVNRRKLLANGLHEEWIE